MINFRVINSVPQFIVPILDLIADHTGWRVSLFLEGLNPQMVGA